MDLTKIPLGDVLNAFLTIFLVLGLSIAGFYIYNSFMQSIWETKQTLKEKSKEKGLIKGEDGIWRLQTDKKMTREGYEDKTQR
ncbi:hypothetical protein FRB99_008089 [Tulasnella sp. 403]|nr:hypothetical protein FRB99_008089 [Tulasnella sp. 403]